jgi:hypothetical protein
METNENQVFVKLLNDRIETLSKNTILELRNLMSDLKIYFIGLSNINEPLIKPWSVVGKYVRKCIIIYEKMSFEKMVDLCKQASVQFRHLSNQIAKNRQYELNKNQNMNTNTTTNMVEHNQLDHIYEIDNSSSPTTGRLFLNESSLTVTSEFMNRSAYVDYSVMDLEPLDESLTAPSTNNNIINNLTGSTTKPTRFNLKALTSTVSAQRTLSNFKSIKPIMDISESNSIISCGRNNNQNTVTFSYKSVDQTANDLVVGPTCLEQKDKISESLGYLNSLSITNSGAFSRKIAEFFVAQQAYLIENNEYEALSPTKLQEKIDELISHDPNFADAYYLKYLNFMRFRDYPSALKALHDYFDRLLIAGSISLAALNLCSLEYRFDNL